MCKDSIYVVSINSIIITLILCTFNHHQTTAETVFAERTRARGGEEQRSHKSCFFIFLDRYRRVAR